MELTREDLLGIVTKEYDEDDKIGEHFSWYRDKEESTIKGDCGFHLLNFFERSIGQSFNENDFFVDIKMSLLNSAVDELQDFFTVKVNRDKYREVFLELFYTENRIKDMIREDGVQLGFWRPDEVPNKVYEINNLNLQIPKIKYQWLFFVIYATSKLQGKDLKILSQRFLGLRWTRSKEPIEFPVFNEAQERIRNFARIIKKYEMAKCEGYNLSLSLFCFNEATNFLDLVQILNSDQGKKISSSSKLVEILYLEGLSTRNRFYSGQFYGEVLHDENLLLKFNRIFSECRMLLENIFKDSAKVKDYGLPTNIAPAFVTYRNLLNDSSYEDSLLKNFMKLSDVEYKIGSKEFEMFGMLYKELYRKNAKKC